MYFINCVKKYYVNTASYFNSVSLNRVKNIFGAKPLRPVKPKFIKHNKQCSVVIYLSC